MDALSEIRVSRGFYPKHFVPIRQELHTFSDASDKAIGHVSYMRSLNKDGEIHICLISASSKLCPRAATTTPRLELCAALEASKAASVLYNIPHPVVHVNMEYGICQRLRHVVAL